MPTLSRIRSAGHLEVGAGDAGVGHPAGVLDQDSTPPSDSPRVNTSAALAHVERRLLATGDPERHHAAEALHLPRAISCPGCSGRPGIEDLGDLRVAGQEVDDPLGVVAVPLHPHRQRPQPAQHQPGVERAGDGADGVLVEGDLLGELVVAYDERAADDVGVPAAVLRRRVDDDVGAERQRLLEVGRGEGVVDDEQRAGVVGDRGQSPRCRRC